MKQKQNLVSGYKHSKRKHASKGLVLQNGMRNKNRPEKEMLDKRNWTNIKERKLFYFK